MFTETQNQIEIHEMSLHDQKVTIGIGVYAKTITGLYLYFKLVYEGCYVCLQMRAKYFDKQWFHGAHVTVESFCNKNFLNVRCQKELDVRLSPKSDKGDFLEKQRVR